MQAYIFDLDDTLYDLSRHRARHLRRAWASWLDELPDHAVTAVLERAVQQRIFFRDMQTFLMDAGVDDAALREELVAVSQRTWFTDLELDAGVAGMLSALAQTARLGLITNGPSWTQRAKIEQFQLARWFPTMIVSGEFGYDKPDPRIFSAMLDALAVRAEDAVMVGDNPDADIRGAHAVGMRAVWVQHPHMQYPDDLDPPWRTIPHVRTLLDAVSSS